MGNVEKKMSMEPEPIEEPFDDQKEPKEKVMGLQESDLKELDQVLFEINMMYKNKTWEILEDLGKELQVRGRLIELYSRYKRITDRERNN